ncbi:hypothetical protein IWQ57_004639, partial [Coemansia nantahalensis]
MRVLSALLSHFVLVATAAVAAAAAASQRAGLVNTNLIRTVDLRALPAVTEQVGVVVQNEHSSKAQKSYVVVVPAAKRDHLARITVRERKSGAELGVTRLADERDAADDQLFQVSLRQDLQPGEKVSLNIDF